MILDQISNFLTESPWFAMVGAGVLLIVLPKIMRRLRTPNPNQDKEVVEEQKRRIMQMTKFDNWLWLFTTIIAILYFLIANN